MLNAGCQRKDAMSKTTQIERDTEIARDVYGLDRLSPNPLNPRRAINRDDSFDELVASVKQWGILEPLIITSSGVIIAGHRRYEAAKEAGLIEVPVSIREFTESEQLSVMLVENLQREGLSPLEEAQAFARLRDGGLTPDEVATQIGLSLSTVRIRLDLLTLPESIQVLVDVGQIPVSAVVEFKKLETATEQETLARDTIKGNWGMKQIKSRVQKVKEGKPASLSPLEQYKVDRRADLDWSLESLTRVRVRLGHHDLPEIETLIGAVETHFGDIRAEIDAIMDKIVDVIIDDDRRSRARVIKTVTR